MQVHSPSFDPQATRSNCLPTPGEISPPVLTAGSTNSTIILKQDAAPSDQVLDRGLNLEQYEGSDMTEFRSLGRTDQLALSTSQLNLYTSRERSL